MNDTNPIELDGEIVSNLDELAQEAGMSPDEYLRLLLVDRASALLKQQEAEKSLFLP